MRVVASLDYIATASDEGVLKLPARTELDPEEIKYVFGYPRYVQGSPELAAVPLTHQLLLSKHPT